MVVPGLEIHDHIVDSDCLSCLQDPESTLPVKKPAKRGRKGRKKNVAKKGSDEDTTASEKETCSESEVCIVLSCPMA